MKYALLLFYAAGTLAAPFLVLDKNLPKTDIKSVGCSASPFRQGSKYAYDYAGETLSNIEGASKQWTGLRLTTRVFITPLSECKFSMQLSNSELSSKSRNQDFSRSDDSSKLQRDLEKYELLFTMNGDEIQTLVSHDMEEVDVLNIKRGILSTLQVVKDSEMQTDVNGVCKTTITKEDGKIIKTKNLSNCYKRAQNIYSIQSATFKTATFMKPLDSNIKCTYEMDGDTIKKVYCEESHLFKPFSAGYKTPSGAMTVVKQTMKLVNGKAPVSKVQIADYNKQSNLLFDHSDEETKSTSVMASTVESIMSSLAKKDELSAKQDSAHEFAALVMVLRKMNKKAMTPVWDKYFDCIKSGTCGKTESDLQGVYRQYLLDAIAYCGTSTCVSFVRDVIIDGEVSGERVNMFLQSIALVGQTAKDMIKDVLEIARKQPSRQAFLSLGTLMYRHCSKSPKECEFEKRNPISEAEVFLERKLGEACNGQDNHERVEEILLALKSIGNARRPLRIRGTLLKCAELAKHSNITHSALNAFKNMPCDGQFTDKLLNLIKNEDIDPEKRIHAFSAAMKCPSEYLLERLVKLLEQEPSKQVASFMWSHLSNIIESSDPANEIAKEILTRLTKTTPLKVVDLGMHQYSRFFEKSLHSKKLDSGATAEGQVIYNPDGYFPRTGKMNMKATLLGESIDVFETMVHIEGLEDLLEDALGPDGVLPKDFLINIFNYTVTAKTLRDLAHQREEKTRSKRGARLAGKLNNIHESVNMKPSKPTAHFNIKIMGQEMRFMSYDDIFDMIDQIDNSNVIQTLMDLAKGGHKTFTKSMIFLEMTHVVPTAVGMPLKLKLTGSTVATLEMDGKFDIRNMFWGPGSVIVKGYFKPSAVVEIAGQMGIETAYGSSGVMVNSNMFVSHMTKGNIIYTQGKLLKINIDTPEEPVQLFNVSSAPYIYMNEKLELIEGTDRRINPDYCVKSKVIGYGLCTSVRLPIAFREYEAPYFPLSGPAHFGVKLVRGDENLKTYQFKVKMEKKSKELIGDIEFSTPGAYYERTLTGQMRYSDVLGEKTFIISTKKNGKNAELQFSHNPNTKSSFVEAKTDFFTSKPIVSKAEVFKTNNMVSEQYGLSYTLTHDWYKFQHVSKFVKKDSGYMLHSATEYYKKNSVVGVLEYSTKDQKLSARFDANQLKQSFEVSGQLKKSNNGKGITLTGTHLTSGKSASLYTGYVNSNDKKEIIVEAFVMKQQCVKTTMGYYNRNGLKSLEAFVSIKERTAKIVASLNEQKTNKQVGLSFFLNGKKVAVSNIVSTNSNGEKSLLITAAGKSAQSKVGYYKESGKDTIKAEVNIMGHKAEMFFNVLSEKGYTYTFGGIAGKYSAGLRGRYTISGDNRACLGMYYGTKDSEKQPGQVCGTVKSLSKSYTHKRISFALETERSGTVGEIEIEAKNKGKESLLTTSIKYMDKEMAKESILLTYTDAMNADFKYILAIGKYNGGYRLFTKSSGAESQIAIEGSYMEKNIMLMSRIKSAKVGKGMERSLTTELIVNGRILPVGTAFNLLSDKRSIAPSAKLTIGKYGISYATMINYLPTEYSWLDEIVLTIKEEETLKFFRKSMVEFSSDKKEISYKFGLAVAKKSKFEYGWEAAYQNRGSVSKSAHDFTLRLQYSTTRKSSVTFTLVNGKKNAEVLINVEYIPGKTLSHSIVYNKNIRQLDISIEFLPKMHTKFMTRLDTKNGYKFTTDFSLQWKKYKKSLNIVNKLKNNNNLLDISTSIGDKVKVGIVYKKNEPRSLQFGVKIMKHTVKIVTILKNNVLRFNILKNAHILVNVGVGLKKAGKSVHMEFYSGTTKVLALSGDYNRFLNVLKVSAKSGKKDLVSITGRLNKSKRQVSITIATSGKPLIKVIGKQNSELVSLKFVAPKMKSDITFAAALDQNKKSVTLSAESGKHIIGTEARLDWKKMVMSLNGFYNSKVAGVKLSVTDSAIIYEIKFTPEVSMRVTFEIKRDQILRMSVERQAGKKFITELSTHFKLSRKMSQFALNWNTKYAKTLISQISPIVKDYINDITKNMKQLRSRSTTYVKTTAEKMKRAAFDFVENADNKFDAIDFVGIRDNVGNTAMKAMKEMSSLVNKALKNLIKVLNLIKKELPGMRRQLETVTRDSIKFLKTLPVMTTENMDVIKVKLNKLRVVIMKVATNLTESSKPVVNKAIELIKAFKVRGMTLEEIVKMAKIQGTKHLKVYMKQARTQLKELQDKLDEVYGKSKTYVLAMKLPYRNETVAEVTEIIQAKIEELKQLIAKIDSQELMNNAHDYVMKYELQGKSVKRHLTNLKVQLGKLQTRANNWPQKTRKMIHRLIKFIREYSKKAEIVYGKVVEFSKPFSKYVVFVKDSAIKRFGPIYKDTVAKIEQQIGGIELPSIRPQIMKQLKSVEDFIVPLTKPLKPLYKNLARQVRQFKIMGFQIGTVMDMNVAIANEMVDDCIKKINKVVNKQIDILNNYVEKYSKMTTEQMVDMAFDSSSTMGKKAVEYIKEMYNKRQQMAESRIADMNIVYQQLKSQVEKLRTEYEKLMEQSPEDLLKSFYKDTEQKILYTVDELSSIAQQLADFDVSKHTWTAWKQADVLGHLDRYGINGKVNDMIKKMKDVNFNKVIMDTVKAIKRIYNVLYTKAFVKGVQSYNKLENAYDYIRSIPKKEYEQWYSELKQFTLENRARFVNMMMSNYEMTKAKATNLYELAEELSKKNYRDIKKTYVRPIMKAYKRVARQSALFYDDVKEPTIQVTKHYNDIGTEFANRQYEIYREIVLKSVENMKSELESQYKSLRIQVEKLYNEFLSKYGDLTWDQVADNIVEFGEKRLALAKMMYKKQNKFVVALVKEYEKQVIDLLEQAKEQYSKYLARFNSEVKPKFMAKYQKLKSQYKEYRRQAEELAEEYKVKAFKIANDMQSRATAVYNKNKDKTIKDLYIEIKTIIVNEINRQYKQAVTATIKKSMEMTKIARKYYSKAGTYVKEILLPELSAELESLINQTLKNTVDMTEEIVKAYTPHFNFVKNNVVSYSELLAEQAVIAYKKSRIELNKQMAELVKMLEQFLEIAKEHKYTKQAISEYKKTLKHKSLLETIEYFKKIMRMAEEKYEEIMKHPTTIKYQRNIVKKFNELNKLVKEYQKKLQKLSKHPIYLRMVRVWKKIRRSAQFTAKKIVEKVKPNFDKLVKILDFVVVKSPTYAIESFVAFRKDPVESFWLVVKVVKYIARVLYKQFARLNSKILKSNFEKYSNSAKTIAEDTVEDIFDDWTKNSVKIAYNEATKFINEMQRKANKLPVLVKNMIKKAYKQNMQQLKQWFKKTRKNLQTKWNNCQFKAIIDNEIWSDIAKEVINHEITTAGVNSAKAIQEKVMELKPVVIKEMKKQQKIIEAKFKELKGTLFDNYNELKEQVSEQYDELINKYKSLVVIANNFVKTTTIAQIVEYAQLKYGEILNNIEETKLKLIEAKERYIRNGMALYKQYKAKTEVQYKRLVAKVTAMYKRHIEPRVEKVRGIAMKYYKKNYPILMAKYNKLREQAEKKYEIYSQKAIEMYKKYRIEAEALLTKSMNRAEQMWKESSALAVLIKFKGMTIRETIEVLKQLPTQTKEFALEQYIQLSNLAKVELSKRYKQLLQELTHRREQLDKVTSPCIKRVMVVYKWVENEITETALFVYRYNHIEERSMKLKNFVISEVERLVPIVKENLIKYANEYKVMSKQLAYDYSSAAGHNTLRGIHSAMRTIDNMDFSDLEKYNNDVREYFTELTKYITIDLAEGEILINIPHREIKPSISHHIRKTGERARRSVKNIRLEAQKMMKDVNNKLAELKLRAEKLRKQIIQRVMGSTVELRSDMKKSMAVNKKIGQRLYVNAKLIGQKLYRKAMAEYKIWKAQAKSYLAKAKSFSEKQYLKFLTASEKSLLKASDILADIYSVGPLRMPNRAFFHAKKYFDIAKKGINRMSKKYQPMAIRMYREWRFYAINKANRILNRAMPYYQTLKKAVKQVRNGVSIRKAFKPIYHQLIFASRFYQRIVIAKVSAMKNKFCKKDAKLCKLIKDSARVHNKLFEKYSIRALEFIATGKAHMHRAIRRVSKCTKKPFFRSSYKASATIFGNNVLTFDKKYFQLINNDKAGCGYLLAHDFRNNKFTLKKEGDAIVVETSHMSVSINKNGKTKTKIGRDIIRSLPVESKSGHCVRKDSLVICHFIEKNFKLVVDLKNDITTFSISGWYYGKTQGILGTYNRESYDDWKLPNGKISTNIYEFFNAYETSGKAKCQMKPVTKKPKACNQAPSAQCGEIFKKESSPFSKFFGIINPEPFWQSCIADTSACTKKYNSDSYCKSVAAYIALARASGQWIKVLPECMSYKKHTLDSKFPQKALKNKMDVVVLVSQRGDQNTMKSSFSKVMLQLNAMLKQQDIRYAVVGFGGQGINERAHVQPLGLGHDVFGNNKELIAELKSMSFDGQDETSNDAYYAILRASTLHFRPGASKVFILFNSQPQTSHSEGPVIEEAKYALEKEAEATLIVFDKFNFKRISKRQGVVFGQSTRKLYTTKQWKEGIPRAMEFPSSEYREFVENTDGAMFQNKITNPKHTAQSVVDVLKQHITRHTKHCKICKVASTWTGTTKVLCQTQEGLEC